MSRPSNLSLRRLLTAGYTVSFSQTEEDTVVSYHVTAVRTGERHTTSDITIGKALQAMLRKTNLHR